MSNPSGRLVKKQVLIEVQRAKTALRVSGYLANVTKNSGNKKVEFWRVLFKSNIDFSNQDL